MKRLLLLLFLILGIVYCVESNFLLLSSQRMELHLPDPYSEQVFWSHFSSDYLRFCPAVFFCRDKVKEKIEREIPVDLSIKFRSFRDIQVSAQPWMFGSFWCKKGHAGTCQEMAEYGMEIASQASTSMEIMWILTFQYGI